MRIIQPPDYPRERENASRIRATAALSVVLLLPLLFAGCPKNNSLPNKPGEMSTRPQASETLAPIPGAVAFNGARALDHVKKQMDFGPRPPGSPELTKTREYIIAQLKSSGLNVTTDPFRATTPMGEKEMINITAEVPGESKDVVIISSHYDSKFVKDMHFVGANDPGASVGALLELARVLGTNGQKPKLTYWLVFFDGEEALCFDWDECKNPNPADASAKLPDNTYGSRRYVAQLIDKSELKRVRAMILLDMMGYKNLELGRDDMSTRWLQDIVWQSGRELGYDKVFVDRVEGVGGDDHEPFLKAGIDSLDMIQLSTYHYWHTPEDTLDKISAQSLKTVGDAVLASLPKIEDHILHR
jgi:glutaminyl-peptide cyclotransferase